MKKDNFTLKFSLALLEKEPVTLEGVLPPEFLELDDPMLKVVSDITYRLEAAMVTGNVTVTGVLKCRIAGECGRCLEPVTRDIATRNLALFYDELGDAEELDVTDDVRSELLLEFPMNLLCSPDCKGLCPVCGANLNKKECGCDPDAASPDPSGNSLWNALDKLKLK
ncbi:MAG: DUF177 domain-containing protein [Victivallaceae bacterium]|nr:DUF177 domain-containing protein [Victivallaceae bacterium]